MNFVKDSIDNISECFQETRLFTESNQDFSSLKPFFESIENDLKPIAVEGISMSWAARSLNENGNLETWKEHCKNIEEKYTGHLYTGLGWAIGSSMNDKNSLLQLIPVNQQYKVADGWGFLKGMMRRRVNSESTIIKELMPSYEQGTGRALWYKSKGNLNEISQQIDKMSLENESNIWLGVGLAATFAGGMDKDSWNQLIECSANYKKAIKVGVAMATYGRSVTDSLNDFNEIATRKVLKMSVSDVIDMYENSIPVDANSGFQFYNKLVSHISEEVGEG